ncbi:MAG: hypothetical protein GY705_25250, partial [Bacteroidetes bacterium]|nr:hypothetical protein [Bacteroidota bacterium]
MSESRPSKVDNSSLNENLEGVNSDINTKELDLNTEIVEVLSHTCWYLSGKVGSLNTEFLIDSGSTFTIIDYELFMSIPENDRPELEH